MVITLQQRVLTSLYLLFLSLPLLHDLTGSYIYIYVMGRRPSPCCDQNTVKKGAWTPEEDEKLMDYIHGHGHSNWKELPKRAGLNRCGKSCRLRWANYLRPGIRRGNFSDEEEKTIIQLHSTLGNKWSAIASQLPGRTDNEIKNHWHTVLKKRLIKSGINPATHTQLPDLSLQGILLNLLTRTSSANLKNPWDNPLTVQADAIRFANIQLLQSLIQVILSDTSLKGELDIMGLDSLQNSNPTSLPQLSNHFQGLANGSSCFVQDANIKYLHSNLGLQQVHNNIQVFVDSSASIGDQGSVGETKSSPHSYLNGVDATHVSNNHKLESDSLGSICPSPLFLVSQQDVCNDQMSDKTDVFRHSWTSIDMEAWDNLNLDDQDNDVYWNSVNQISSLTWHDNIFV